MLGLSQMFPAYALDKAMFDLFESFFDPAILAHELLKSQCLV